MCVNGSSKRTTASPWIKTVQFAPIPEYPSLDRTVKKKNLSKKSNSKNTLKCQNLGKFPHHFSICHPSLIAGGGTDVAVSQFPSSTTFWRSIVGIDTQFAKARKMHRYSTIIV
jgi:hypothetical protein